MLTGHNGSGKTTLLRLLAGALRPDAGQGRVAGTDLRDAWELRRRTALLAHASSTWDTLTARDNLEIVARATGAAADRESLLALLGRVGLASRADEPVLTFSAGMRRRLAIARLLLQDADLVLLDEPWAQLDPEGLRLVDELIADLVGAGRTVVFSTHMLEHGIERADEAVLLSRGRVGWRGDAVDVVRAAGDLGWG